MISIYMHINACYVLLYDYSMNIVNPFAVVEEEPSGINLSLFVSLKTDKPNLTGSREASASLAMLIYCQAVQIAGVAVNAIWLSKINMFIVVVFFYAGMAVTGHFVHSACMFLDSL